MKMKKISMKKLACLVIAATIGSIGPLQATPRMVGQSGDWLIYSFDRGGKEICYVLSVPEDAKPLGVDHGKNYFLVAPGKETSRREPEAIMGYPLKPGSADRSPTWPSQTGTEAAPPPVG